MSCGKFINTGPQWFRTELGLRFWLLRFPFENVRANTADTGLYDVCVKAGFQQNGSCALACLKFPIEPLLKFRREMQEMSIHFLHSRMLF